MKRGWALLITAAIAAAIIGILSYVSGYFIFAPIPEMVLNGEREVTIEAYTQYTDPGLTAMLGKKDLTDQVVFEGAVDVTKPGTYILTYRLTVSQQTYTSSRSVTVVDKEVPVLELLGDSELIVSLESLYQEPGYTANDRCDGNLTDKVQVERVVEGEQMMLTYTVSDAAGNSTSLQRHVTIRDIVAPVLTLNGYAATYVPLGSSYSDPGYSAVDDADGDITGLVVCSGSVDDSTLGTYTINYSVTDKAGNTATATRVVKVFVESADSPDRVYLTFDDGPSSEVTGRILDILAANNAKATFFIVNYGATGRQLIARMINEGHTVAIHGYSHDYATIYANDEAFMNNVYALRDKLLADFGYNATIIRFPGGSSNTVSASYNSGIMSRLAVRVEQEGFSYFDWNVSSGDAAGYTVSSSDIYYNVTGSLRRGRNNVVLMHDTNAKWTTADALQDIINYARGNGYSLLPITSGTYPVHHGIAN